MSATTSTSRQEAAPRPTEAAHPAASEPVCELVDLDRYVVLRDGPVGYIEVIPPLFICYCGHPYPKAVEVAQVFDFDGAVRSVLEHAERTRAHRSVA